MQAPYLCPKLAPQLSEKTGKGQAGGVRKQMIESACGAAARPFFMQLIIG